VDAGEEKIEALLPAYSDEQLLAGARRLEIQLQLGITAWLDPLAADYVLRAYKMLADRAS